MSLGPFGARLTPRKSFEEWSELVKHKAQAFSPPELRVAETLRGTLLEVILLMSDAADVERRASDERQTLLIAELNHRVRNILSLIRGLMSQTRKQEADPATLFDTLGDRVMSLARAHDQLTQDRWRPTRFRTLIETEITAFLSNRRQRVVLEGPDVTVVPQAYTALALVMHELVTNASKYGALSDNGTVTLSWTFSPGNPLLLHWREAGGPIVQQPRRQGFGSAIIEKMIPHDLGGKAEMRFRLTGFEADFEVPERFIALAPPPLPSTEKDHAMTHTSPTLTGLTALVVEDNLMIAMDCEASLLELGADKVLLASSIDRASAMLSGPDKIDIVVLDVNLGSENSLPIANMLSQQHTPFIFATGYGDALVREGIYESIPTVTKPYTTTDLSRSLATALSVAA